MHWVVAVRMLPVIILYNTLVCRVWSWTWHHISDSSDLPQRCWCHAPSNENPHQRLSPNHVILTPLIGGTAKNGKRQLTKNNTKWCFDNVMARRCYNVEQANAWLIFHVYFWLQQCKKMLKPVEVLPSFTSTACTHLRWHATDAGILSMVVCNIDSRS